MATLDAEEYEAELRKVEDAIMSLAAKGLVEVRVDPDGRIAGRLSSYARQVLGALLPEHPMPPQED